MSKDRKKFTAAKRGPKVEPILEVEEEKPVELKLIKEAPPPSFKQLWNDATTEAQKLQFERVSEFSNITTLHWVGFRKDSNNGKIWGYFTEKEYIVKPDWSYGTPYSVTPATCFIFFGSIGETLTIEERKTDDMAELVRGKRANYKTMEPNKMIRVITSWPQFNSEVGMFLTYRKLAGK
jgi:hypothetical protein